MRIGRRPRTDPAVDRAEELVAAGRLLDAVDLLQGAVSRRPDAALERRLVALRHAAFAELGASSRHPSWPVAGRAVPARIADGIPVVDPAHLAADAVRDAIMARGSVLVPQLLDADQVAACVAGIDRALAARDTPSEDPDGSWHHPLPLPAAEAATMGRRWVAASGAVLAVDSPRMAAHLLDLYERVGLRPVVTDYLGERPALSANKWTLRRVSVTASTDWHQDGSFLGDGIRALNLWIALTDCGEDAPGMDLLPRRLDGVVETGTGGAYFDWSVGHQVVESLVVDDPIVRPRFRAGDALLFDDLFLHRTAVDPAMTRSRYAVESWFFAPSAYPAGQVPIAW